MFTERIKKTADFLKQREIRIFLIEDTEGRRNPSLRYLCGQPNDSVFALIWNKSFTEYTTILIPWDVHIAELYAKVDLVLPFTEFGRQFSKVVEELIKKYDIEENSRIEIPSSLPYPAVLRLKEKFPSFELLCRDYDSVDNFLQNLRAVKDAGELEIYDHAAEITDSIINALEKELSIKKITTEIDAAFFIESEALRLGAEGLGFETLAAGPLRSFGIHAFPAFTSASILNPGLSILDFGIQYQGYTSDVTLTIARGKLTLKQELMIRLIEEAHSFSRASLGPGISTYELSVKVDDYFASYGMKMPHALGHGIGIEAHEIPFIRSRKDSETLLDPGMIVTLEPGLYDPEEGGCRLENDFLITENGFKQLTQAKIIYL